MAAKHEQPEAKAIVVHTLGHANAALAAAAALGVPVVLLSPPGAGAYLGAGYFHALVTAARAAHPRARASAVLDCADHAGHALAALRQELDGVVYDGPAETAAKIAAIAAQSGAVLWRERGDALDLLDAEDPEDACREWLRPPTA